MAYQPIENYGVIGDMHTVALVGLDGSIDWCCVPRFDSPSVFGRILDDQKGGYFWIRPAEDGHTTKQMYWPDTNVLVTRFFTHQGAAELTDFMPVGAEAAPYRQIVRRVTCARQDIRMRMECRPAFNYARDKHRIVKRDGGVEFMSETARLALASNVKLELDRRSDAMGGGVWAEFTLKEGESAVFVLREVRPEDDTESVGVSHEEAERVFRQTVEYWRRWIGKCRYTGRWREMVRRSALALKLMTYQPTGAIVAAPTCSLPEAIGGERNWDYRYTWIRDSAFTIYALLRLGFTEEASAYVKFLEGVQVDPDADHPLKIMYTIDGRSDLTEQTLDHLEGYKGSRPVRIGNGAHDQLQMDIYGELLDAAYLYNKWGEPISIDMWRSLAALVDWVCDNWRREDRGIWEVRGPERHFVSSKMMCWVAVDRGLRLADKRSFPADRARWLKVRDEIYEEILEKGWSDKRKAFVQSYGSEALDASNLMMPLVFFVSPTDPRMLSTLDAMLKSPRHGGLVANSLVYRYHPEEELDDLRGEEGTFNICTFWLVEALTRAGHFDRKRLDETRLIFERMHGFANHLGLYAEETDNRGEALGNFPQAFTHLALISAAFNLDRALGGGG